MTAWDLSRRIRAARKSFGMSNGDLATASGLTRKTITDMENGIQPRALDL